MATRVDRNDVVGNVIAEVLTAHDVMELDRRHVVTVARRLDAYAARPLLRGDDRLPLLRARDLAPVAPLSARELRRLRTRLRVTVERTHGFDPNSRRLLRGIQRPPSVRVRQSPVEKVL